MACRRSLIYFSNYVKGEALEKAGCAVIWFFEEDCRIELLYRSDRLASATPTYCFADGECVSGECLTLQNGLTKQIIQTKAQDFLSTGRRAEDLVAICIAGDYGYYGGGRIDGKPLSFLAKENPPYPAKEWIETVTRVVEEDGNEPKKESCTEEEEIESSLEEEGENRIVQVVQEEENKKPEERGKERQEGSPWTLEELSERLPEMKLPSDGKRRKCCRMESADLLHLPKQWHGLQKNHFLLHGFYQYHHVLLVREGEKDGERYAIGVPGVFYYREQYMAETFGFPEFHPLKPGSRRRGEFGYWYLWLDKK